MATILNPIFQPKRLVLPPRPLRLRTTLCFKYYLGYLIAASLSAVDLYHGIGSIAYGLRSGWGGIPWIAMGCFFLALLLVVPAWALLFYWKDLAKWRRFAKDSVEVALPVRDLESAATSGSFAVLYPQDDGSVADGIMLLIVRALFTDASRSHVVALYRLGDGCVPIAEDFPLFSFSAAEERQILACTGSSLPVLMKAREDEEDASHSAAHAMTEVVVSAVVSGAINAVVEAITDSSEDEGSSTEEG